MFECRITLVIGKIESACAFMFSTTIMEQRDRLAVAFMEEEIDSIEVQFKDFLRKYHNDEVFKHLVENTSKCETFAEAGAFVVSTTIMEQRDCLAVSFMEEEIDSIEV